MDTLKVDKRVIYWTYVITLTSGGFVFGSTFTIFNNFFPHYMNAKFPDIPQSKHDSILTNINTFTAIGQLLVSMIGPFLFQTFPRRYLFIFCSTMVILSSIGTVVSGLWLSYIMRLIQVMFAFYYQVFVNVYLKETLPVREVGIAGSLFYIFMGLGYIFSFYMKYDWTEKYYWLVLLIPAFLDLLRMIIFFALFRFDGPKYIYFSLKKKVKPDSNDNTEDDKDPQILMDTSKSGNANKNHKLTQEM
jgi:MFS family permease